MCQRLLESTLLASCLVLALPALAIGQRVIPPQELAGQPVFVAQIPPSYGAPPATGTPGFGAPAYGAPATAPSLAPPSTPFAQPYPYGAPTAPAYAAPTNPLGSYPGAPAPYQQPFGSPVVQQPLSPQPWDPYGTGNVGSTTAQPFNEGFTSRAFRLLQEARLQGTYIGPSGSGNNVFGVTDIDMFASFGFPVFAKQPPIIVTPGFGFHLFQGPTTPPPSSADLPGAVYDAYLATSWRPQITQQVSADLAISVGDYSDFTYTDSTSIRVLGRGLGLVTLSPRWQLVAGVLYVNRLQVKLLPAGGLIFTPHPDSRWELLFPNPKISQRLTTLGSTDLWGYIAGEYGGGQWSITHANGVHDVINYNDLRLLFGIDWFRLQRVRGNFEVGYVFSRSIIYTVGSPQINPPDSFLLRAGISY